MVPLQIVFLWHPLNKEQVEPLVKFCSDLLSSDERFPFARTLHIPLRYCTSVSKHVPTFLPFTDNVNKTLVFSFVSDDIVSTFNDKDSCNWVGFIQQHFIDNKNTGIVHIGIALSKSAYRIDSENNFIRCSDFPDDDKEKLKWWLFVRIAHEIYRYGLAENTEDSKQEHNKLKIFLSHTKEDKDAVNLTYNLQQYINNNSLLGKFFDTTSIEPGANFENRITNALEKGNMAFLAIRSDHYASRYWCQKEILLAKKNHLPMLSVDILKEFEDRSFPFLQNIPSVRIDTNADANTNFLKVLAYLLLETIRYVSFSKEYQGRSGQVFSRPPELFDAYLQDKGKKDQTILYPFPLLYDDELKIVCSALEQQPSTPFTRAPVLKDLPIGISVSDVDFEDGIAAGIIESQDREKENRIIKNAAREISGFLVGNQAKLVYGGDFRSNNGVTRYVRDELQILQNRLGTKKVYGVNYTAWPIYQKKEDKNLTAWLASCAGTLDFRNVDPPQEVIEKGIDTEQFLAPDTTEHLFLWGCSLTQMREIMIEHCWGRISLGGRCHGYKGKMPGVLEEVLIALEKKKPIYLLGGFGGITEKICQVIQQKTTPEELTFTWQKNHNIGYGDLQQEYQRNHKDFVDYQKIIERFINLEYDDLEKLNGLNQEDNIKLFHTVSIYEATLLILKGITKIKE